MRDQTCLLAKKMSASYPTDLLLDRPILLAMTNPLQMKIMESHGQARACTPECLSSPKRFAQVFRHAGVVPKNSTHLRQPARRTRLWQAGASMGHPPVRRNPPKHDRFIA